MATERKRISNTQRKPLTAQRLRELLSYDQLTGDFTRVGASRPQSAHYVDKAAGFVKPGTVGNGGGYVMVTVDGKAHRAHRLAWLYMTGDWPEADIDHRDGNRANNRWDNLRAATRSENIHNMGLRARNTSGRKGACYDAKRQKWLAQIVVNGKYIHLGRYETRDEAGDAYDAAARRHFGVFARAA